MTIAAMTLSIALSASLLFWPPKKPPSQPGPELPTEGLVGKVVAEQSTIFLKSEERIVVGENDLILLDGALCQLDALLPNDQLAIKYLRGPDGTIKRIMATRDSSRTFAGQLQEIDSAGSQIALAADGQLEPRRFAFDGETAVLLNGKPATAADLRAGDSLLLHFRGSGADVKAERLEAKRQLTTSGVLESFDPATREIAFRTGQEVVKLTLADQCQIRLNKRSNLAGRAITLADLTSGDQVVSLTHDSHVLSMDLQRELSDVVEVWSVDRAASRLTVLLDGNQVGVSTGEARIAYQGQPVELGFVRKGDRLVIAHDSPDRRDVVAASIEVTDLVRDPRVTAIVIAQQAYDGVQVTPYEFAVRDAGLVRAALDTNARVPEQQLIQLTDQTRDGLAQAVNDFLAAHQQGTQLIVYFVGQAYVDMSTGTPYLAGRDFSLENIKETGLKLRDLIGRLEQVQAREKILILDTCHKVSANETQAQPSTEEQVRSAMVGEAVSRSVTVIASCGAGQRGRVDSQRQQGLFGIELAQALSGKADTDGDQHVSADELFRYLEQQLAGQQ
ncbi:MAG: hypothetical protein FJ276_37045, partial [Planctomycetes bacterium]|nr:hypothetical protein [Planctomycetota bacterium]